MNTTTRATTPSNQPLQSYEDSYACGCSLFAGICETHQPMMRAIRAAWLNPVSRTQWLAIEAEADGYGKGNGSMGGDWSGIRDSTPAAVEAMYQAVLGA